MALLVPVGGGVYSGLVEFRGVSSRLIGRYVPRAILRLNSLFSWAICSVFSAIQYWLFKFLDLSAFCANQVLWIASFSF